VPALYLRFGSGTGKRVGDLPPQAVPG